MREHPPRLGLTPRPAQPRLLPRLSSFCATLRCWWFYSVEHGSRRATSMPATSTTRRPRPPKVRKGSGDRQRRHRRGTAENPHLTLKKTGTFVDGGSEPNAYADPGPCTSSTLTAVGPSALSSRPR